MAINEAYWEDLRGLLRIESVSVEPEGDYPFGHGPYEALKYCLDLCERYGMRTKYCGNYLGYAEIGEGDPLIGILAHVDVVPAGSGWSVPPYDLTIREELAYGRGITDDKGPAMAVIHAMKDLAAGGEPIGKRIRLILGCSEETGDWKDIDYYRETEELPDYGFTPDSDFPLVFAEKGIIQLELRMDLARAGIQAAQGGEALNVVPAECTVDGVSATGRAAHASMPWEGENAISKVMAQLQGPYAEFYNECFGAAWDGSLLGVDFRDELSGGTTVNAGAIRIDGEDVVLGVDIRIPVSMTAERVIEAVRQRVEPYGARVTVIMAGEPMCVDPKAEFIQRMMAVYREVTGDETGPQVQGGGTYAKALRNIVAFGPSFPGMLLTEHQADERILVEDMERVIEIYRKVLPVL